ncbi:hypothetical protein T11_5936 [Trichinella zimbabwensis]|uniref:Uncharacterized protein n=1 Tax=Trichinella zimbabwensis TaxID=268475 RepID=A0A0V1G9F7_9BILA|nr:hypothetical protein T11_5936 [Trichinella zimbabwensis]
MAALAIAQRAIALLAWRAPARLKRANLFAAHR